MGATVLFKQEGATRSASVSFANADDAKLVGSCLRRGVFGTKYSKVRVIKDA